MNQKDIQIKKLWDRGVKNPFEIARRVGFQGAIDHGVLKVAAALKKAGVEITVNVCKR